MGTAKMPRTSDPAGSADDLISELARLMAEDAQGDRPAMSDGGQPAAVVDSGAGSVDTLTRPEQDTSPSARLNASGGAGLYDSDELRNDDPVSRFPAGAASPSGVQGDARRSVLPASRPAPRFQAPPPLTKPASSDLQSDLPGDDLGYENDVLGEADPFADIPAIATSDDDFPTHTQPQTEVEQSPVLDDDPIAELIAAQLQQSGVSNQPAPIQDETPPEYEETDQFGAVQPHPSEVDNFDTSPVFGLGGAKPQPARSNDPLAEIQSLIGDAVHVSAPEAVEDPEVVNSLVDRDVNDAALAAEAAIAAATAATAGEGAPEEDIHQVLARRAAEAATVADINVDDMEPIVPKTLGQRLMGPAIAAALLLAIGGSMWWVFGSGPVADNEAPVLNADTDVVKAAPEPAVASASEPERSVVFDELSGNTPTTDSQQLLSRDQTEVALEPENLLAPENTIATSAARIVGGDDSAGGLANRKVRTVTVRPDGTIVSGDDSIAGGEVLPVDRPDVPALPEGTQTAASEFVNEPIITQTPINTVEVTNPVSALVQPDPLALQPSDLGTIGETGTLVGTSIAPIPRPRPNNRPTVASSPVFTQPVITNSIGSPAVPAGNDQAVDLIASLATASVAPPVINTIQPATVSSVVQDGSAAAYVQLSSQRSPEAAQQSLNQIQRQYRGSLAGGQLEIQRAEVPERGTFFRVRMPASSVEVANSVCADVKFNGGDCFVRIN